MVQYLSDADMRWSFYSIKVTKLYATSCAILSPSSRCGKYRAKVANNYSNPSICWVSRSWFFGDWERRMTVAPPVKCISCCRLRKLVICSDAIPAHRHVVHRDLLGLLTFLTFRITFRPHLNRIIAGFFSYIHYRER